MMTGVCPGGGWGVIPMAAAAAVLVMLGGLEVDMMITLSPWNVHCHPLSVINLMNSSVDSLSLVGMVSLINKSKERLAFNSFSQWTLHLLKIDVLTISSGSCDRKHYLMDCLSV